MAEIPRTLGRHITRRLTEPRPATAAKHHPGPLAEALSEAHNGAVRAYGSDSGGFHAFDPAYFMSNGVHDGIGGFPAGSVVTPLAWGFIDAKLAQRVLEGDGLA